MNNSPWAMALSISPFGTCDRGRSRTGSSPGETRGRLAAEHPPHESSRPRQKRCMLPRLGHPGGGEVVCRPERRPGEAGMEDRELTEQIPGPLWPGAGTHQVRGLSAKEIAGAGGWRGRGGLRQQEEHRHCGAENGQHCGAPCMIGICQPAGNLSIIKAERTRDWVGMSRTQALAFNFSLWGGAGCVGQNQRGTQWAGRETCSHGEHSPVPASGMGCSRPVERFDRRCRLRPCRCDGAATAATPSRDPVRPYTPLSRLRLAASPVRSGGNLKEIRPYPSRKQVGPTFA